jgi:hypothetical protein
MREIFHQQRIAGAWAGRPEEGNMSRRDRAGRGRFIEGLEPRRVPSAITILAMQAAASSHGAHSADTNTAADVNNELLNPTGVPTPRQQARERFVAQFTGTFMAGPGQFSSQAQQFMFRGAGGSNQFLHGDIQLRAITPLDPTQPLTGETTMFDRNLNSNSVLGLDLVADPTSVDKFGRPTLFTISQLDQNVSSGYYDEGLAQGTVSIRYLSGGKPGPHGLSQGKAVVAIHAQIYSIGTDFILTNAQIDPKGPSQGGPNRH